MLAVKHEDGDRIVTVAPIIHAAPANPKDGLELPAATKRRLGLDDQRSWIVATEVNRFRWPGPDLRPISPSRPAEFAYGGLPKALMLQLVERISTLHQDRRFRTIRRDVEQGTR